MELGRLLSVSSFGIADTEFFGHLPVSAYSSSSARIFAAESLATCQQSQSCQKRFSIF